MSPIEIEQMKGTAKRFFRFTVFAAILFGIYKLSIIGFEKYVIKESVRRETICPSLLSISRSARDTLIVMKSEPLCNSFVLDNLK